MWDGIVAGSRGLIRSSIIDGRISANIVKSAIVATYSQGTGDIALSQIIVQNIQILGTSPSIPVDAEQQVSLQLPPIRAILPMEPTFANVLRRGTN